MTMMKKFACVLCLMAFAQSAIAQSMLPADKLKALNETQQKMVFKLQLNANGEVCGEVLRTMYQGGNSSVDIWSVGCTAGELIF